MDNYDAFPNLTQAAAILGISTATLSRRGKGSVRMGGKELRLSPGEVMEEAIFHKRRPLTAVAGELVRFAHTRAPQDVEAVQASVASYLAARPRAQLLDRDTFLAEARRALPRRLFAQVQKFYAESPNPPAALGPAPEDPTLPTPESWIPRPQPTRRRKARATTVRASADTGVLVPKA